MESPADILCFVLLILSFAIDIATQQFESTTVGTTSQPNQNLYTNCGGHLYGSCGIIRSPQYPNNYPSNCQCTWEISTPPGTFVVIYFPSLNIEEHPSCFWDSVSVHDGPPGSRTLGLICVAGTYTFYATSNIATLVFKSDVTVELKGFQAIYYTQTFYSAEVPYTTQTTTTVPPTTVTSHSVENQRCGGQINRRQGGVTSPFYPSNYPANTNCTWEIFQTGFYYIHLYIYIESLENHPTCIYDYLEIRQGDVGNQVVAKLCQPGYYSYTIITNKVNILFISNGIIQGRGFEAQFFTYYETGPNLPYTTTTAASSTPSNTGQYTNCGGNLTESSGTITSPLYPQNYPPNCLCVWRIIAPVNKTVQINFRTFNLEYHATCAFDSVTVYNGEDLFGKWCNGTYLFYGSSSIMKIEFRSDGSVEYGGFMATYNFVNVLNVFDS